MAVALFALGVASSASATPPDFLLQVPEDQIIPGKGAAELDNPRGIAGDPDTGHIYISDLNNARIDEYTAWGLFVKSWGWGVANGANEAQTCVPAQPDATPPPTLCQQGKAGAGRGQVSLPLGVAVDGVGNVYVFELGSLRVQKFNAAGQFLLMIGGQVNKTKVDEAAPAALQNRCPVDPGDVCQAGITGTAPSYFAGTVGNYIAYSPTGGGTIVVGDKDRIQIFNLDGTFKEEIAFEGDLEAFDEESVTGLDVDQAGNIYLTLSGLEDVYKLSPSGEPLAPGKPGESEFEVRAPAAAAVDVNGSVYAIDKASGLASDRVVEYDAAGNRLLPTPKEAEEGKKLEEEGKGTASIFFPYITYQGPALTGLGTNVCADGTAPDSEEPGNLYVSFFEFAEVSHVNAYGTPPIGCEEPPLNPPEVLEQFATAVGREEATLKARINPRFWADTTYYVEYGTGECAAGGCNEIAPLDPALLTGKVVNKALLSGGVVLSDLEPGTTYHYRFVAESTGGGPVFGEDPDGKAGLEEATFEAGVERTFRTFAAPTPQPCANDAFRASAGARLPDCRGYEMVSPLDKGNADVALWLGRNALFPLYFELHQSAPSGDRLTYTSWTSFGEDAAGAGFASQYLADRGSGGWSSENLSPPRTGSPVSGAVLLRVDFQGFTEGLCTAWVRHFSVAPLAEEAIPGYANIYRRDNCGSTPNWLALTIKEPEDTPASKYFQLRVQGFSDDGQHTIFTANGKLEGTDAPGTPPLEEPELRLYERYPGGLRFVCYLPNGTPVAQPCGAGTASGIDGGNNSSAHNAISADGERIFWTTYGGDPGSGIDPGAPGRIFVRVEGAETRPVSTTVAADPAWFWTASNDGSKAIFEFDDPNPLPAHADELYEVDVETETPRLIADGVEGPMGASEDASRIYFASTEDLDGAGEGAKGAHNLYLYETPEEGGEPTFTFIMALASIDIGGYFNDPSPIDEIPAHRWARVSADGLQATFVSAASPTPTGYDNRDVASGEAAREVYHYDAAKDRLLCISCNPSGARPTADDMGEGSQILVAARIQGWEILNHAPRVLSEDGRRVFFESIEALAPEDTNGVWDVYQWEEAGKGSCTASSASFSEANGGCIDLISSGESGRDATFLDADPSGDNVFFGTLDSLVGADYGLNDVYVARVGGGFPEPVVRPDCEGEACQSPPPPPPDVTPASETFKGPEDVKARKRCPRGKHRIRRGGKARCVRKRGRHRSKHAGGSR